MNNLKKSFLNRIHNYLNDINMFGNNKIYFPSTIYLEVTNFCNAKCIMCPNANITRKKGYMSWELFKKIIDECSSFEHEGLTFYLHKDGEPLLDPLLFKRIMYIKSTLKKSKVCINTNGALLNEEKAKKLIESGIDQIIFSVDGTNNSSYEKIRIGLNYYMVESNIDRYFKLKKQYNKKIYTILQMVVCEINQNEIEEFKRLWIDKADQVYIKPMHNFLDMHTSIKTKDIGNNQLRKCLQPFDFMLIYWNGDVGLCCWDYNNFANLGDVISNKLLKIYNNKIYRKIRSAMENNDCRDINPCNRCSQIYGEDMDMEIK